MIGSVLGLLVFALPAVLAQAVVNPYADGYTVWVSPSRSSQIANAAAQITDPVLQAKALKVTDIPTFTWLNATYKISSFEAELAAAAAKGGKQLVQAVIYNLPDRVCGATNNPPEFTIADDGVNKYKTFIDSISNKIQAYPSVGVVAIIEPQALATLITGMSNPRCSSATSYYRNLTAYALEKISLNNTYLYLDGAHAGLLGWPANLAPAAKLFGDIYRLAGSPRAVRGVATNVANYNAFIATRADPNITLGNPNYDESKFIAAFRPLLVNAGFPGNFIVEQGRSGVQELRGSWSEWCNLQGAGFGIRPTTNTGVANVDAIVWVKPGGESDGTSDTTSPTYDASCGAATAKKPAPEYGSWFQAYFEMLVQNANPTL